MASRSTFRDPVDDVAYQRQLRDRYAAEPTPPVPHLDLRRAVVRPISRRTAEQVILKYEWLGTMATTGHHFGLFFGPYCAGVCAVGIGGGTAGVNVAKSFGVAPSELATLARGACAHWAPLGTNSKLVSWTCRTLAHSSRAKLIVAYADSDAGEIGTIYQASNWVYIGPTISGGSTQMIAPNGRIYDMKIVYDTRRRNGTLKTITWTAQRDALVADGWIVQPTNPKHRYVYVLDRSDRELFERIEAMRQPYPKRAKQSSDAPAVQVGEGGAAPTGTLQESAV